MLISLAKIQQIIGITKRYGVFMHFLALNVISTYILLHNSIIIIVFLYDDIVEYVTTATRSHVRY